MTGWLLRDQKIRRAAERAHTVFLREGWVYGTDHQVPSVDGIEGAIRSCLESVDEIERPQKYGENRFAETGRIRVQRDHYKDNGDPELTVYLRIGDMS